MLETIVEKLDVEEFFELVIQGRFQETECAVSTGVSSIE